MKKVFVILLTLSAISMVLSGCGKKDEEPAAGTTTTGTTGDKAATP